MKRCLALCLGCMLLAGCAGKAQPAPTPAPTPAVTALPVPTPAPLPLPEYRALAYVTVPTDAAWRWIGTDGLGENDAVSALDARYVTHATLAFGMLEAYAFDPEAPGRPLHEGETVSPEAFRDPADGQLHYRVTLEGWIEEKGRRVDGREYLRALTALKEKSRRLRVMLSVGGWDSDGFCYMARTREGRAEFIGSCVALVEEYGLDGLDLDWEYPTNGAWGTIAHCDHCVEDARALVRELRAALEEAFPGEGKLLSVASGATQPWVDRETLAALDFVNLMAYDADPGSGGPQAPLSLAREALVRQLALAGDSPEHRRKMHLGLPFYNEGGAYLVPYYLRPDYPGTVDASPEAVAEKAAFVRREGLGGAFYWAYGMDISEGENKGILQRTLYEGMNGG